jgi:hypothetical protein
MMVNWLLDNARSKIMSVQKREDLLMKHKILDLRVLISFGIYMGKQIHWVGSSAASYLLYVGVTSY